MDFLTMGGGRYRHRAAAGITRLGLVCHVLNRRVLRLALFANDAD